MIWFALILALIIFVLVALYTRSFNRALYAGLLSLALGIIVSLFILFSGVLGG